MSKIFLCSAGFVISPTGNLDSEEGAAERVVEDVFIRCFLYGTFVGIMAQEPVLKRRANVLIVCLVLLQNMTPSKIYFLASYTETLLSHFYKCPVKLELQTVPGALVYKYL
ncbi:28S ribosomal protein S24, mitochondrial [Alligator sinensis]|uniref:28S ribosomal protein S24, mitochondrial n=1 Tax=Alligator sinensis TaxID=38654 RepID=A0A3Q0FIM6_ALLSI|nr:28S ribosomal protein S24, mitochondrial [Alligator sinensis]